MKKQKGGMNDECPICLEPIHHTQEYTKLRCAAGHFLHDECLEQLTQTNLINNRNTTCPLCREIIDEPSVILIRYIDDYIFDDTMESYRQVNLIETPTRTGNTIKKELLTILSYDIAGLIIEYKILELNNNGFDENEFYFIQQELLRYTNGLIRITEPTHRDYFLLNMFASIIVNLDMILSYPHVKNYSLEELNSQESSSEIEDQLASLILQYLLPEVGGKRKSNKSKKTKKSKKKVRKTRRKL